MEIASRMFDWLTKTVLLVAQVACAIGTTAWASSTQFHHNSWTEESGIGAVYDVRQAYDGYLWLQTSNGIFRFDGIRFESTDEVTHGKVSNTGLDAVLPAAKGGVWFMTRSSGLLFWKDEHLTSYPDTRCTGRLREAPDGSLWVASNDGLFHLEGAVCKKIDAENAYPGRVPAALLVDREGTVWVKTWSGNLLLLRPGQQRFEVSLYGGGPTTTLAFLHEAPDGSIWLSDDHGFRQVRGKTGEPVVVRDAGPQHRKGELFGDFAFADDGSVWIVTDKGVRWSDHLDQWPMPQDMERSPGDSFTLREGLTSDVIWGVLTDREGSVWLATNSGLDQIRRTALHQVALPPAQEHQLGVAAGNLGTVWTGSESLQFTQIQADGTATGFPKIGEITFVQRDRSGVVWVGSKNDPHLWRSTPTGFDQIHYPAEGKQPIIALAQDRNHGIWITLRQYGLLHFVDGHWSSENEAIGKPATNLGGIADDASGNVWIAFANQLVRWDGSQYSKFSYQNAPSNFGVSNLMVQEGHVWLAGNGGVEVFTQNHFRHLNWKDKSLPGRLTGVVETKSGDLWTSGYTGVTHVSSNELAKWLDDPDYAVVAEHMNTLDGLPGVVGEAIPKPSISESLDGRLWFATTRGIAWLDPATLSRTRNRLPPPVVITSAIYNGSSRFASGELRFPPHAKSLELNYTALSFVVPQRVLFRYKLDGIDEDWKNAGTRRQAFYNSLPPGHYHFRVVASNNDGVWNDAGASLFFTIAPAFYQTWWFRALLVIAAVLVVWMFIRLRIRTVSRELQKRLSERLDERERIARELHDTLLQGLFGLILRLQFSMDQLPDDNPVRVDITKALTQSESMMQEGRDRIKHLRSSQTESASLVAALELFGHQLQSISPVQFNVAVDGLPRLIDPYIHEEILLIGREALTNAFRHSGASTIGVHISYRLSALQIRVHDNGRGVEKAVLEAGGRKDHWGLPNMRERAKKMHATLRVELQSKGGTQVELRVPASIVYKPNQTIKHRLWFILGRTGMTNNTASHNGTQNDQTATHQHQETRD